MQKELLQNLQKYGWLGKVGATACQVLFFAYPGLTMSTIAAAFLIKYTSILEWVQKPDIYSSAGIFLFILWTYIGLGVIRNNKKTQMVRIAHDYAYGLILDGSVSMQLGRFPANHRTNPGANVIMLGCNYRNISQGPLKMKLEEFRVVLNNRTNDDGDPLPDLIFARLAAMGIRCGGVPYNESDTQLAGTMSLRFIYGHPDGEYVRQYSLKVNVQVAIHSQMPDGSGMFASIDNDSLAITDAPYVAR